MAYKIPFGDLQLGPLTRHRINQILDSNWISEGAAVAEFEEKFAEKFRWKHAIATSSGTDAGMVVWSAVRELSGFKRGEGYVLTPACAFVASANCLSVVGLNPDFLDVQMESLNLNHEHVMVHLKMNPENISSIAGIQFVASMGHSWAVDLVREQCASFNLYLIGDWCEAHGAMLTYNDDCPIAATSEKWYYADHLCDASIYSFYVAHLIVGGEGGMICTDDDEIAELCRSIKSHGRPPGSNYFDFQVVGFNSKWNDLCAAVALEGLERFDETFTRRREVRRKLLDTLAPFEDRLILYRDEPGEIISPHAFPIVLRDETADMRLLYRALENAGVQCKTLFGSLPTQHRAFEFLGYKLGDFPVAERIGRTGLHFSTNEFMTDEDIGLIADTIGNYLRENT